MHPSAKIIAFPVRRGRESGRRDEAGDIHAPPHAPVPKLKIFLIFLLAPLLLVASALTFVAVVGVFLVWSAIVCLLVAVMLAFARQLLLGRQAAPVGGFRRRLAG